MNRRYFLAMTGAALVPACTTIRPEQATRPVVLPVSASSYGAVPTERFALPAIDLDEVDPRYLRRIVDYPSSEVPGTVVVDPHNRFLYLVLPEGRAMRYGIGVGRAGFAWSGRAYVGWKRPWPTWTPPASMIARQPELERYRDGMAPGLDNPLGARAIYIFEDGHDTLYRFHGTNEPWSIGKAVSSGCIRLFNQDAIDLYNRVQTGAAVVVLG
ncbi:MAG TPA: L,D-transpeptidase [Afifellaceae bacterium]|nr:L,D-transpeptidase [Afifellaceae bacterium]